ncbi:MAG TPA: hypothetical protein VF230_14825, partial [Acidimicrobiales bacterium]
MRLFRPVTAATAAVLLASGLTGPAVAQTAATGVGTSMSRANALTTLLGTDGSLLNLALVSDESQTTLDSGVAAVGSTSKLALARVGSSVVSHEVVNQTVGLYEAKSTGPTETSIAGGALAPAGGLSSVPVLGGTVVPGKISATLDNGVANAGIIAELSNATGTGGLVSIESVKASLGAQSSPTSSTATRAASISNVTVLDLGAVLQGLGIDLTALPVDTVTALVDKLKVLTGLELPDGQTTLTGAVDEVNDAIDEVQATLTTTGGTATGVAGTVDATVIDGLTGLLGETPTLPTTVPDPGDTDAVNAAIAQVNAVVDALQAELERLVVGGVQALDDTALLRLEGVEVGVNTKAVQDLNATTATVTGKVGKVFVGQIELPVTLDIVNAAAGLNAAVASINTQVREILGTVHAELENAVSVSVLDKLTQVSNNNGYSTASAGIVGATATVTPPATLATIVASIGAGTSQVVDLLPPEAVDEIEPATGMKDLGTTLNLGFTALSQPATVKAAEVLAVSNFKVGASNTTAGAPAGGGDPVLPATGGNSWLIAAGLAGMLALAAR